MAGFENPFDKMSAAIDNTLKNTAYKDRSVDAIRSDVKEEFSRVDKRGYRDDQEIYQAGINIIDRYIKHISLAKNMRVDSEKWGVKNGKAELMKSQNIYKDEALKFFRDKRSEFARSWINLSSGINLTSSAENRRLINKVATDINAAENEALKKIKLVCNPKQENLNAEEESSVVRDRQGNVKLNGAEIVRQKPMFTVDKKTGLITFTDRSNPVKIHDSLKGLFKKDGIIYEIDYTNCKNENIKKKMMELTGGEAKCLISFNKEKGTYLIRNSKGETWENRALIWEGVTLKRDELRQWEAREKKKAQNAKLGTVDAQIDSNVSPEADPKLKKFTEQMPNELKEKLRNLGTTEYRRFIVETENRLNTILKEGKAEQYELHAEPVSKKNNGLMEVHFVNDYAEKDVTVFDSSNRSLLGDNLYNMLDGNEGLMKEYVTTRVQEKWREFDDLTVRENSLASHERTDLKDEEKLSMEKYQSISNGIRMLNRFIDEHRQTEGDSWLDNGDKYLASIVRKVRDLEYSIKESLNTVSATDIENEIIEKAISIAKDWDDYIHDVTTYKETFQRKFRDIFLGTKEQQIDAIRYLSRNESFMDRTESSFLADEIVTAETDVDEDGNVHAKGGLEVNDTTINTYFQNINTCLLTDLNYDESGNIIPNTQTQNIDELYNAASDSTGEGMVSVLIAKQMIPESWRNNSDVRKRAKELAKTLNDQMKIANSFTVETIREGEAKEKLELEMKSNKTEADLQRLQALNYLEHHPEEAALLHEQILQKTKEELKYGGINNVVRRALASVFVEEGGGAKGANADIYNDIVGYGFRNLSDENAKIMGEILVEITITVAIAVATGGMGAAATAGLLRVCATGARAAKWVKTAERISKIASLSKNGYRGLSASSKVAKFAVDAPGLLFEGTIFNNASKTIHAAFNGTSLDSLNFNPLTRENIETAAFLCALGIGNQIAGKGFKVLDKPGKYVRTKLHLNPSESLKSIGKTMNEVGAEMGGMLLATEGINLTFGHEVVDPDTGEVKTERGLSWPTNEEWATMIGMIIAFKAVKPGMWRKLADKLNDGTLIVCRTENRKNPVIRNTKTGMIVPIKDLPKNTDILNGGERTARGTGEGTGERTARGTGERTARGTGEGTGERTRERTEERTGEGTEERTGERTEETGEGTRERTEETGDRAREETEEIQDIEQVRRELAEKESRLKGEENEAAALSRNIERLKRRTGTMDERQKERLERFVENLAKRNEDIAKLKEEIKKDKDVIAEYERSQNQQVKEETRRSESENEGQRRPDERVTEGEPYTKDANGNILPENYERMSAEELVQEYQKLRDYEASGTRYLWKKTPSGKEFYRNSHDSSARKEQIRKILEEKYNLDKNGNPLRTENTRTASEGERVAEGEPYTKDANGNILPENYERMSAEELVQEYQRLRDYEDNGTFRPIGRTASGEVRYLNSHDASPQKAKIRQILEEKYHQDKNGNPLRTTEGETTYFDGKKSKFNIAEEVARSNSQIMDKIMDRNNPNDLAFLRETISIQYKTATGKDCPELTDQQLKTIIEAHKQLGELGNLTQGELLKKVRVLSETITDANFRRFLLESGFCGKGGKNGIETSFKRSLVDRDQFADTISKNRYESGGYPKGKIEIRKGQSLSVDKFFKNNPDLKNKYIEALKIEEKGARDEALSKLDVELAEKRILDTGRAIEFGAEKAAKADVSYDALNKVYNGRIERIVRDDGTIVLRLKEKPVSKRKVTPKKKPKVEPIVETEIAELDFTLVERDQFADTISKNRKDKKYPEGNIEIRKGETVNIDEHFKNHPDMKAKYEDAANRGDAVELAKIDVELAEQVILETGRSIEFKNQPEKAQASYDALNKVYNGRIERIDKADGTIVLKLKQEVVPAPKQEVVPAPKGEVVPVPKGEVVPAPKGEIVKTEPGLLTVIESGNVPAVIGERLPATITLKGGEIVPTEKVMPPAVQKKLNTALAVIEKRGGLPAVIQKNPEIIPVLPSKGIVPPYWLVPLLLIPGLNWSDEEKHSIIIGIPKDISDSFDKLIENPKITGVELPTDITGPFDSRGNMNAIKAEIDTKFDDLLRENNIQAPIKNNALILLRGVSSRTYRGRGDGERYNKDLSLTRAEEFKKYLMQKFPELTDDNFVLDSHYQPDNIDEAQRFQGVSMGVVDMQKYGGITSMRQLIPSGQDGRVL